MDYYFLQTIDTLMLLKKYRTIRNTAYKRIKHQHTDDYSMCRYCVFDYLYCNYIKCQIANFDGLLYNVKYSIVYVVVKRKDRKD